MKWTEEQWTTFLALLAEWWPGDLDEAARGAWRVGLDGMAPEDAAATLKRLLHSGRRFRPSVSEFIGTAHDDPSRETFDEALILVRRALSRTTTRSEALEFLARYPLVASFVDRQGVDRLRMLPIDDPEWGEKHRRDLEAAWDRHCETTDGRRIAAIASGDGPHKLDPLSSLQLVRGGEA